MKNVFKTLKAVNDVAKGCAHLMKDYKDILPKDSEQDG